MCSNASRLFATTAARPKTYGHTTGGVGVLEGASPLCVGLRGDWGRPGQARRTPHCVDPLRAERPMPHEVPEFSRLNYARGSRMQYRSCCGID